MVFKRVRCAARGNWWYTNAPGMHTYTQILYQIIFSTKYRQPVMTREGRGELYRFLAGMLQKRRCKVYIINGVEDHLHIITHLHPSVSLAQLVKELKLASSKMIKGRGLFPDFTYWAIGYAAFTYADAAKPNLIRYVRNQEVHHRREKPTDELRRLLLEQNVAFEEDDLRGG